MRTHRNHLWSAVVALLVIGFGATEVRAERPRLVIVAPSEVAGDGASVVELRVRIEPESAVAKLSDFDVVASAGTLGKARPDGDRGIIFPYTPPLVGGPSSASIRASARIGRRAVAAVAQISIGVPVSNARRRTSDGVFGLSGPGYVVAGNPVELSIETTRPGEGVRLFANVGSLRPAAPSKSGVRAMYTAPSKRIPGLLIIVAVDAESRTDWLAIPIHGGGRMAIDSEPNATVELEVAGKRYGPFRTDRKGRVRVPIAVPPGVRTATTHARDDIGNEQSVELPLTPPPPNRLFVLCPDRHGKLRLFVAAATGGPSKEAGEIRASVSTGALGSPERVAPGVYEATYSAPLDATGTLSAFAELVGESASRADCTGNVPGELPTGIRVALDRGEFAAGSGTPVRATVELDYPGNLPPRPVSVQVTANLGAAETSSEDRQTSLEALWRLPDHFERRRAATLTATVAGTDLSGQAVVNLRAGPAVNARLVPERNSLTANGRSSVDIDVIAADEFGNAVVPDAIELDTNLGTIQAVEGESALRYRYRSPRLTSSDVATITVAAGESRLGSLTLRLSPAPSRWEVGAHVGYLTNLGRVGGPSANLTGTRRLPWFGERLALGAELGVYRSNDERPGPADGDSTQTRVFGVPILARATFSLATGSLVPYLGAVAGGVVADVEVRSDATGPAMSSELQLGVGGLVGVTVAVGPGRIAAELRYLRAALDTPQIEGNAGGFALTVGYALGLF